MSYLNKRPKPRRAPARGGLGDSWTDYFGRAILVKPDKILGDCYYAGIEKGQPMLEKARAYDAKKLNGFWTVDEFANIRTEAVKLLSEAYTQLSTAANSTTTAPQIKADGHRIYGEVMNRQYVYLEAWKKAVNSGIKVVDAPGYQEWIADVLYAAYQLGTTAWMLNCNVPSLASAIIAYQRKFDVFWGVVEKAGNAIVAVGETVLKVAGDLPQIWTVVKWGGLAAIGLAVAIHLGKMRKS